MSFCNRRDGVKNHVGVGLVGIHCIFLQPKEAASMYKNMNHCSHRLQTDGTDESAGLSFQRAGVAVYPALFSFPPFLLPLSYEVFLTATPCSP